MDKASFVQTKQVVPTAVTGDHGGVGTISFRRLQDAAAFGTAIDFVDFTVIPPASTIGGHVHGANEELYLIAEGSPIVRVGNDSRRLDPGDIAIVRPYESHELLNDTNGFVKIFVVQVAL